MQLYDIVVIGGGPGGLSVAISAKKQGVDKVCIIERESSLGGMLNENIHNGFRLGDSEEYVTGPEYIQKLVDEINEYKIETKTNSTVLRLTEDKKITYVSEKEGIKNIKAKAVVLATGCREQSIGAINIPRNKCVGIYTCGTAHKLVNLHGYLPGKEVIVYGSSNLALLTARRLKLEGANVKMVVEKNSQPIGKKEYFNECIDDFNIPFKESCYIVDIKGKDRVEGVTLASLDKDKKVLKDTECYVECDTLLLSVQLFPETDITVNAKISLNNLWGGPVVDENMCTSVDGIFACGNLLKINYDTNYVVSEGNKAGEAVARYIKILKKTN
ncbi:FAD-dependent oxidoreductase [Clostridium sp. KNHs214]|uniref:NAD(P)/FAD-dependent oxidoreductase n=1 Tax=Clostridium sp. KNHs214 TaxID=1540257 RepID=UPI00068A7E8C|nr:FAD-dependent oxidoreductase [Clostridium sp. KNHs214]